MQDKLSELQRSEMAQMYKEHNRFVFNCILQELKCSPEKAEELTEETFARAIVNITNKTEPERILLPKAWLAKIARSTCINYIKSKEKQALNFSSLDTPISSLEECSYQETLVDKGDGPEQITEKHELHRTLINALKTLDKTERSIIYRHYFLNETLEHIADVLKMKKSSVEYYQRKGKKSLRTRLMNVED